MSRQFWGPKYNNELWLTGTNKHLLSFIITYQEGGTINGGDEYTKTMVVDSDEAGWKPFDVTKEFRAALDSGFRSGLEIDQADYCLAHGYFTAQVLDREGIPVYVTPDGFKTHFLLAVLVRVKEMLHSHEVHDFVDKITGALAAGWDENIKTVFPQRLLVVVMQPEGTDSGYIVEDRVRDRHIGAYVDIGFVRPVRPRAPKNTRRKKVPRTQMESTDIMGRLPVEPSKNWKRI